MKITTITAALSAAAASAAAVIGAPSAFADDLETQTLGQQAELVNGDVVQGWTVSNLKTSTDVIPYPVHGTLWEATATDEAVRGSVTPIVSNLNARARSGETYRALFQVATPQGVNPSTLAQGQKTTGKVYFDVTGDTPDSVIYNAGGQDLALWVQPPPSTGQSGSGRSTPSTGSGTSTTPAPGTAAGTEASVPPAAGTPGTTLPTGNQGTPVTPGSQGTPITPGTGTTPGAPGTPVPAGTTPGSPVPAGTTPGAPGTPVPAGNQGTPVPAGSQGTAAAPAAGVPAPAANQAVVPPVGNPVVVTPPSA